MNKWVCCGEKDDGDYHLVLAEIAEVADPDCPGARDSVRVSALRAVRQEYDGLFGQPPKGKFGDFQDPPLLYVTGVAFFDEMHGQKGVAPNGIQPTPGS